VICQFDAIGLHNEEFGGVATPMSPKPTNERALCPGVVHVATN
jgi:hypothetical protein